jgi:carbon-monoxide dehydrogenase medium subunit
VSGYASEVHDAATVGEAVALLEELGEEGALLAGGTWILRSPLRREPLRPHYVAARRDPEMTVVRRGHRTWLGALVTHAELSGLDRGAAALGALAEAARRSAFPAVRHVATLAGNLAARPFPEADLVPALLAGEAEVELAGPDGRQRLDVAAYLAERARRPAAEVIVGLSLPAPAGRRSWFERLTVRRAAEYSLASVAVSVHVDGDGVVTDCRVAIGAVEEVAARSEAAEAELRGRPLAGLRGEEAGRAAAAAVRARDGLDAPGWYRRAVLPRLVGRAVARLAAA